MPGVYADTAPCSAIMAGVFELDMDGTSSVPGAGGGLGGGRGSLGGLGAGALDGASNGGNEVVEVDEENMSKDAMAVDMREMKEPDMQKLNEVRRRLIWPTELGESAVLLLSQPQPGDSSLSR